MTLTQQWRCLNPILETAFTSCFLRKVSWVIGKSFQAVPTFFQKEVVHSLAVHFQTPLTKLNNVGYTLII